MAVRCRTGSVAEHGVPLGRAARELGLKPNEFELAVQLGEVRTAASGPGAVRRVVPGEEIERHRSAEGFPEALRARLWTVGTADGAELAGVGPSRFTRLARCGLLVPVRFWINRYGAVVWQYLASEVAEFADSRPGLLTGRLPADLRAALDAGGDERGVRWRRLRVGQLVAGAEDPWQRAAATAAVLSPAHLIPAVPDPGERAWVSALRPTLTTVRPSTPAGRAVVEGLVIADGPEEVARYQERLAASVAEARERGAVPGRQDVGGVGTGGHMVPPDAAGTGGDREGFRAAASVAVHGNPWRADAGAEPVPKPEATDGSGTRGNDGTAAWPGRNGALGRTAPSVEAAQVVTRGNRPGSEAVGERTAMPPERPHSAAGGADGTVDRRAPGGGTPSTTGPAAGLRRTPSGVRAPRDHS
uniref:DUF6397 family protein n=1 Tax=Streptomyces sp. I05A-00742 TaxID=2732853 RepID=UPI001489AF1A